MPRSTATSLPRRLAGALALALGLTLAACTDPVAPLAPERLIASAGDVARATSDKGTGCYVGDANGQYYFDPACTTHTVVQLDDQGNLQFYAYQDLGQLPAEAALPSHAIHRRHEQCFDLGSLGIACGMVDETITPSGVYKSSFRSH